jgi:hypothetical protein
MGRHVWLDRDTRPAEELAPWIEQQGPHALRADVEREQSVA